jgi:hypothetical protein
MITKEITQAFVDGLAGDENARATFHKLIGLRPWQPSPIDATQDECPWPPSSTGAMWWPRARQLRHELLKAARGVSGCCS